MHFSWRSDVYKQVKACARTLYIRVRTCACSRASTHASVYTHARTHAYFNCHPLVEATPREIPRVPLRLKAPPPGPSFVHLTIVHVRERLQQL